MLSRLLGVGSVDTTYSISSTDIPLNNQEFQLGRCTSTFCESIWLKGASHNRLLFLLDGGELPVTLNITITNGTNRFSSMFEVTDQIYQLLSSSVPKVTQLWDSHTNLLHLDVSGQVTAGIYRLSVEKYNSSIQMIASSWSNRPLLPPWVGNHMRQGPWDATQVSSVPLYWLLEEEFLEQEEVIAEVKLPDNTTVPIPLTDDGLLSPDLVADDSLFSGAFYALTSKGWYSPLLSTPLPSNLTTSRLKPTRVTVGQAFFTQEPLTEPPTPSR